MPSIKLTLAYDGTAYAGWQFQPGLSTVQGTLEEVLARITGESVRTVASGRTDAGVHAEGQVVSFRCERSLTPLVFQRALNAELPRDIAVRDACLVPDGFHATHDALRKRYRYVIHDGAVRDVFRLRHCWHLRKRLDVAVMQRAAQALVGTHDFASFQTAGSERTSTVRTIFDLQVARSQEGGGDQVTIEVEADGFLYNMVRTIVGTLVPIGTGRRPESWTAEVLEAHDRRAAGPTAPPQGLFLWNVVYPAEAVGQGSGTEVKAGQGRAGE